MKPRLKKSLSFLKNLTGKHKLLVWGNLCCLILSIISAALLNHVCVSQPDQLAVSRWAAGKSARFAQLSCFFAHDSGFTAESVQQLRSDINKHLLDSAVSSSNKEARLWYDAYSTEGSLSVSRGSVTVKASATAVGGDFFLIHPQSFRSGYYFSKDDVTDDRVILDWNMAWKLFGSFQITGMELQINGKSCYVAGVTISDNKWPIQETYGETPHIYMSYSLYQKLFPKENLTCYEAVLPNPVDNFASKVLSDCVTEKENLVIVENSARFEKLNLLRMLKGFGMRSTQTKAIVYPYWENAARMTEDYASLLFCLSLLFMLYPFGSVIFALIWLWKRRRIFLRWLFGKCICLFVILRSKIKQFLNHLKHKDKNKNEEVPL